MLETPSREKTADNSCCQAGAAVVPRPSCPISPSSRLRVNINSNNNNEMSQKWKTRIVAICLLEEATLGSHFREIVPTFVVVSHTLASIAQRLRYTANGIAYTLLNHLSY